MGAVAPRACASVPEWTGGGKQRSKVTRVPGGGPRKKRRWEVVGRHRSAPPHTPEKALEGGLVARGLSLHHEDRTAATLVLEISPEQARGPARATTLSKAGTEAQPGDRHTPAPPRTPSSPEPACSHLRETVTATLGPRPRAEHTCTSEEEVHCFPGDSCVRNTLESR